MELLNLSALELSAKIKAGELSAVEGVKAVLSRIEEKESIYHCYITVDKEGVLRKAEKVQKQIKEGKQSGLLAGVPIALKDNLCTQGMLTSCGSRILSNFVPPYSAEAVLRMEKAGMLVIGKTNMDEFAMGNTTETSYYGITRNPHHTQHTPGGSSGGSAAAVAAKECFLALGTDTGGSIRQPASLCGVVGLKPTYGTVSRYGLVAYASSLEQIGPLSKTVADSAAALTVLAVCDKKDATSVPREDTNFTEALQTDIEGMKIGIPTDCFGAGTSPKVKESVMAAAKVLEQQGGALEAFSLDLFDYVLPAYYAIASAEASSNLARFDGIKYGYRAECFGTEVKRRIMLGSFVLGIGYYEAYYLQALKVRRLIKSVFDQAFMTYDVLLLPTSPVTAPKFGEALAEPMQSYAQDVDTVAANLAGLPAISVPCGKDADGLPIGMQLIGKPFAEKTILRAAYTYEQAMQVQ